MIKNQNCIINRIAPTNSTGYTYGSNSRVINWRVSSIKDYEYSNEAFDKRGYELRKCSTKERRYYKHCGKGILVRVVDQKNYGLLIRMEWIPESLRERNVYLRPE